MVILSYHSLEDRKVKNLLKYGNTYIKEACLAKESTLIKSKNCWIPLFKKALTPSEEEIKRNRRSRSAKLRVAERDSDVSNDSTKEKINKSFIGSKQLKKMGK